MIRMRSLVLASLLTSGMLSAQTTSTGPFLVPEGSNAFLIATKVEENWRIAPTFECDVVGSELKVTGADATTPCFGEVRYYLFEPKDTQFTTADIVFELKLTCPIEPPSEGSSAAPFNAELNLDNQGFNPVPPGTSLHPATGGDVIRVTNGSLPSSGGGGPSLGPLGTSALAVLLALLGAFVLPRVRRAT